MGCQFTFCDDFATDIGLLVPPRWNQSTGAGGGTLGVVNGQLEVMLPNTSAQAFLVKQLPAPTTSVTIGMRIGYSTTNVGANCELDLVHVLFESQTCAVPFGFYLVRDGTGPFNVQETNGNATCNGNRDNYVGVLDNTGLHTVKLVLTVGNPGNVAMFLDGTLVLDRATLQPVPSAPITLDIGGVIVRNAAAPWTIVYDDLSVNVN